MPDVPEGDGNARWVGDGVGIPREAPAQNGQSVFGKFKEKESVEAVY